VIARRVIVKGRVQGVWYRASCRAEAERLGVRGTVRNRADGAVEVHAEGERLAVEQLISWCRIGPPMAAVVTIDVEGIDPIGVSGFEVLGS
jgi:acylphosphatase